jgi:hypothetical protein
MLFVGQDIYIPLEKLLVLGLVRNCFGRDHELK